MSRPALLTVLLAALLVAGCSTVPSSSPTVQVTQAPARPTDDVGIEPLPPETGATPEEVVRGFIDAAASTVHGHPVARQHLTPQAAKSWSDDNGVTILSPNYSTVATEAGSVLLSSRVVGTVDVHGVFTVGGGEVFTRTFTLQQVKGQWRITDPPSGLLILQPDFERLYDERDAFFIDPTGQRAVPDPRYLIAGAAQPNSLVERVLDGPSPALAAGVRNPLAGVQLRRTVTVNSRGVTVDLTGVGNQPAPVLSEICAQLVWTLDQVSLHDVTVLVDGEPVDLPGVPSVQNTDDWSSFDPDGVGSGSVGHYVQGGALRTVDGKPAPGPAGTGAYALTSAAAITDPRTGNPATLAGVSSGPAGATLLIGAYGGDLAPALSAGSLTPPTMAATRSEVWTVRDGTSVVRVTAGAPAQPVVAPGLAGLGRVTELRLSPDGVRAAVVVDGPAGPTLYMGTVIRAPDGSVSLPALTPIAPSLSQVVDVAWMSSASLIVLAGDPVQGRTVPYTVGVDGSKLGSMVTAGLPSQPSEVAAAPGRQALVSSASTIWQRTGGIWTTLLPGQQPLAGGAPFYPV